MALDDRGFRLGSGSLCSGRPEDPSPVLEQIGHPQTTGFRLSLGAEVVRSDLDTFVDVLAATVHELQRMEAASEAALERFSPPSAG
jgi:cysteine sulfinate desulfinase/cysteine desulfurase-like protein